MNGKPKDAKESVEVKRSGSVKKRRVGATENRRTARPENHEDKELGETGEEWDTGAVGHSSFSRLIKFLINLIHII